MRETKGFSKTAFIVIAFLCGIMIIAAPVIGLIAGKILGAIAIGWLISGLLIGIVIGCMSENGYQLTDDFQWRFSKKENKEEGNQGVKL